MIASRKGSEIPVDRLVDQGSQCALVTADSRLGEDVAEVDISGFAGIIGSEVVNPVLKDLSVPAVELQEQVRIVLWRSQGRRTYKVSVESIASSVSHRVDKRLVVLVRPLESSGAEDELEEDGDEGNWVGVRADTAVVVVAHGIRHVGLVVFRIEIFAIPAGRKVDLGTNAIFANTVG